MTILPSLCTADSTVRECSTLTNFYQATPGSNASAKLLALHSSQDAEQRQYSCKTWSCSTQRCERRSIMSMDKPNGRPRSHLFTVRVWEEEIEADQREWRGKVQLFTSGEVRYF